MLLDGKVQTHRDLRAKPAISARVDEFINNLAEISSDDSDDAHMTRGRRQSLKSGKSGKLTSRVVAPNYGPIAI